MADDGVTTFVEVGPGAVLSRLVTRILEGRPHLAVALDRPGVDGVASLHRALARLAADGRAVDFAALWSGDGEPPDPSVRSAPRVSVPICGANASKIYPPSGGAAALPGPNAAAARPPSATVTAPAPPVADAGWLDAWREAQQHSAEAHTAFQTSMAEAHTAFLRTMESAFAVLGGGKISPAPPPDDSPIVPDLALAPVPVDLRILMLEVVAEKTPTASSAAPRLPAFRVQLIVDDAVWCAFRLVEACFPKGPLGAAPRLERRAFLRDGVFVESLRLSDICPDGSTRLDEATVAASDWLPGTVHAIYGARDVGEVARKEHIAAAHRLHPRLVPAALPITAFDLDVRVSSERGGRAQVHGDGTGALDFRRLRAFWEPWTGRASWPVADLYYGLIERFVRRVVLADPSGFDAIRGRSALYLGNHQVAVESLLFAVIVSALTRALTGTLAKAEHRDTWLGRLVAHTVAFTGVPDPALITYFDRADIVSLPGILADFAARMAGGSSGSGGRNNPARSILVHVEGTRSLDCRTPVRKMSGAFIDMALSIGAPIVPVRFIAGLPYGDRKTRAIAAINALGPPNAEETPLPGDPAFAATATRWSAARGVSPEHAIVHGALAERTAPCSDVVRLLGATDPTALADDPWLAELARRILGPSHPT